MESKIESIKCSFCGEEMECPKNMLNSEKHMCYKCFQNAENIDSKDICASNIHIDLPTDKFVEGTANKLTEDLVDNVFPESWKNQKKGLKGLSKKELSKQMFAEGAFIAICNMLESMKEEMTRKNDDPKSLTESNAPTG